MLGYCGTCFCFRDIRRAVVAIGLVSIATSLIQIIITVAVFVSAAQNTTITFTPQTPDVYTYEFYIALSGADFFMILFAILMLYGNERDNMMVARCYFYPWIILLPLYMIYEAGINIYYFYNQFNSVYTGPLKGGSPMGYVIAPLVYWVIKDIILFIGYIYIIMRVQSMVAPPAPVQYINQGTGCHDCSPGPTYHAPMPMALPPPPAPLYNSCTTACSGGCGNKCQGTQPLYGYAAQFLSGGGGVTKNGFTTSVFNNGKF